MASITYTFEYIAQASFTLYDDESVREKLKVMTKWEVIMDDSRNTQLDALAAVLEQKLKLGDQYHITISKIIPYKPKPLTEAPICPEVGT